MTDELETYFRSYAERFYTGDPAVDRNFRLKLEHSLRVRDLAVAIGRDEAFPERELQLLETAALLHDFGRFEQFRRFGTFADRVSVDHGRLSARLVREQNLLRAFAPAEQTAIYAALAQHNQLTISPRLAPLPRRLTGALRDADKLDIMPILLDYLQHPDNPAIVWNLSPEPKLSAPVATALREHRTPPYSELRTALDFLVSKFGWVYDLATLSGCRRFRENRFLDRLAALLPPNPEALALFHDATQFLTGKVLTS